MTSQGFRNMDFQRVIPRPRLVPGVANAYKCLSQSSSSGLLLIIIRVMPDMKVMYQFGIRFCEMID